MFGGSAGGGAAADVADANDETVSDGHVDEDDGVLMPLIDMLNHDHGDCNTVLRPSASGCGGRELHLATAVEKGASVLYSYGAKSNSRLV